MSPPCYVRVFQVLVYVREEIKIHAVSEHQHLVLEINSIVDLQLIQQQVQHGAFDWNCCSRLICSIVSVIERIQESDRAEQTREIYTIMRKEMEKASSGLAPWQNVLCEALDFLVGRVGIVRTDAANKS